MTRDEILAGIKAYSKQQEEIKQLIRDHGGELTADQFDREFKGFYYETLEDGTTVLIDKKPHVCIWPFFDKDAFFLGGIYGDEWSRWLNLTQLMCGAGILTAEENESGMVVYKIKVSDD